VADFYLLPCSSCGERVRVGRQQAGQLVRCGCGAPLEVPTFAGLARLEKAAPEPAPGDNKLLWGGRQRVTLLAGILLAGALASVGYLLLRWPAEPPQEGTKDHLALVTKRAESLSPAESWQLWETIRAAGLDPRRPQPDLHYEEAVRWYRGGLALALVLAVGSAASVAAARLIRSAPTQPPDGNGVK
jgi:hypothetical protein